MGRTVDFSNTIIIMTSNLGARLITQGHQMGFEKKFCMIDYDQMKKNVLDQVKRTFARKYRPKAFSEVVGQKGRWWKVL